MNNENQIKAKKRLQRHTMKQPTSISNIQGQEKTYIDYKDLKDKFTNKLVIRPTTSTYSPQFSGFNDLGGQVLRLLSPQARVIDTLSSTRIIGK